MMKFLFTLVLSVSFVFAGWVFVNDDGSFSSYGNDDSIYVIPKEELQTKEIFKLPKEKKQIKKVQVRKEIVQEKKIPKKIIPKKVAVVEEDSKTIYLTFDDGPLAGSSNIISTLVEEGTPATMFMVGKHITRGASRKKVYQEAVDEPLILVANHTYTHANGRYRHFYSSKKRVLKDVQKMDAMLCRDEVVKDTRYCRLAGRNVFRLPQMHHDDPGIKKKYKESSKYDALYKAGFYIYGWDYQWSYNPKSGRVNKTPKQLAKSIESIHKRGRTKKDNKVILLMHDFSFQDRFKGKQMLGELITILKKNGWKFETLETYL